MAVVRIIETQRQNLEFKLKIRKGKQPTTREIFYLFQMFRPKEQDPVFDKYLDSTHQ